MRLHLIAVGQRVPAWIQQGFTEFNKRLPKEYKLRLREISTAKRQNDKDIRRLVELEGKNILKAIPKNTNIVALAIDGESWNTEQLAENLNKWSLASEDIAFVIGGPDGLSEQFLAMAKHSWSLSGLTLPHALVRVLVAEQIYRAWSINQGHPYHR